MALHDYTAKAELLNVGARCLDFWQLRHTWLGTAGLSERYRPQSDSHPRQSGCGRNSNAANILELPDRNTAYSGICFVRFFLFLEAATNAVATRCTYFIHF